MVGVMPVGRSSLARGCWERPGRALLQCWDSPAAPRVSSQGLLVLQAPPWCKRLGQARGCCSLSLRTGR